MECVSPVLPRTVTSWRRMSIIGMSTGPTLAGKSQDITFSVGGGFVVNEKTKGKRTSRHFDLHRLVNSGREPLL